MDIPSISQGITLHYPIISLINTPKQCNTQGCSRQRHSIADL